MKNALAFIFSTLIIFSCTETASDDEDTLFDYKIDILSPSADNKKIGDVLDIDIDFESLKGNAVHHINVRVYKKDDESNVIFSKPDDAHVHDISGIFQFSDTLDLTEENGVAGNSDYVLVAKVWGHTSGVEEKEKTIEFKVQPE